MADFLLELLSEEIPARMQVRARGDLARLFATELAKAGLEAESIETFSTPRRLVLIARALPGETQAVSEELKGPRTSAPPQALEGFLRKTGLAQDQLTDRDGVWFAVIDKPGRATASVLAEAVPAIVRTFPWPKSMRWGEASHSTESLRWVRPLQGIVALFGGDIVAVEVDGIASGAETVGHRFHHPGRVTIGSAADYAAKLRACHVIIDHDERESIIATGATAAAAQAGLTLVRDEALLSENAGLTEWPVPLLGSFDPAYLDLPPEVIQLTMAVNQKYFAGLGADEKLAPAFICTANIEARDGGATIVAGNRKVLAARLSDAKFFWEQDLKVPLEEQAKKLDQIVFHEKLGTVADKVERVAKLARWLVEEGIVKSSPANAGEGDHAQHGAGAERSDGFGPPLRSGPSTPGSAGGPPPPAMRGEDLADMAEQAARLCKADLVTSMVGEFPELQGVMGGYYARAQGLPPQVADAIRDHYKPVGQGDDVPTASVTVAVSLADKLDTLMSFFEIGEYPTGSKDPFALRRAAIAIIRLILVNGLKMHTGQSAAFWLGQADERTDLSARDIERRKLLTTLPDFLNDRLAVQQREAGVRHDLVSASADWLGQGDGRIDRIAKRAKALQAFVETGEGRDLLAGYKRAANILKKEGWPTSDRHPELVSGQGSSHAGGETSLLPKQVRDDETGPPPEEQSLISALDTAETLAAAAIAREDFEEAMAALATLRAPVDAFFEKVTVNDPDPAKRAARLSLLARMRDAVHQVADFSRIEG